MNNPLDVDEDPRGWSIDQVVFELCHSPHPQWLPNGQNQYIQNRSGLEDTLRQNDIDGDSLLTLEMTALKEDLGIKSYGIRNVIMKAISNIRLRSRSYQQMIFQADSIARMNSRTFPSPQITQSRFSAVPQSPAYFGLGGHPSVESRHSRSPSLNSGFGPLRPLPSDPPVFAGSGFKSSKPLEMCGVAVQSPDGVQTNHIEDQQQGSAGQFHPQEAATGTGSIEALSIPQRPKQEQTSVKVKKKIAPTFVGKLHETVYIPSSHDGYLAGNALPTPEVFYYKVPMKAQGDDSYRVPADEDVEFGMSPHFPTGQRRAIAHLTKSFLRGETLVLPTGLRVRLPYKKPKNSDSSFVQHFTLFPAGNQSPKVRSTAEHPELKALQASKGHKGRQAISSAEEAAQRVTDGDTVTAGNTGDANISELDYLLAKYPDGDSDEVQPLYGDSGDENDYDEETWQEIQAEMAEDEAEARRQSVLLTPTQVKSAMDEAVEEFRLDWRDTKYAAVQKKAYRHWMQAARVKTRTPQLQQFRKSRDHCQQRLLKLRSEVAGNTWRNAAEVKKQCQVLEVTVHQHEEYSNYCQVMLQDTPPEKPSQEALAKVHAPKHHDLEEGEEVIESEPEAASEDDDHPFIDDQEDASSEAGSIHHDPDVWEPVLPQRIGQQQPTVPVADSVASTGPDPSTEDTPMPDVDVNDADVESDDDDDIITPGRRKLVHFKAKPEPQTPSTRRRVPDSMSRSLSSKDPSSPDNSDFDRTPRLPKSRYQSQGRSSIVPIDLTLDSSPSGADKTASSDFSVQTPELNPSRQDKNRKSRSRVLRSTDSDSDHPSSQDDTTLPKWNDVSGMKDTHWSEIESADTRRALAKAVYSMSMEDARELASFVNTLITEESREEFIVDSLAILGEDTKEIIIPGMPSKHRLAAVSLVLLYITHCTGENILDSPKVSPEDRHQAYEDKDAAIRPFFGSLQKILQALFKSGPQKKGKKRKREQEPLSDLETLDDTDIEMLDDISTGTLEEDVPPSSHKKRKRKVEESQEANSQQVSDKMRIQEQEKRRRNMAERLAMMQPDSSDQSQVVIINTEEPLVQLHNNIASRIKPHQITGLQFLWRETIEDPKQQGCILAHTMGLGKTMQVTSLLVSIAICNQSRDPKIKKHIPKHLRDGKTMILCPASLLNNWEDELMMWTPNDVDLGGIYKCDSTNKEENIRSIRRWSKHGGILLMGYERFRSSITSIRKDKAKEKEVSIDLEDILLNGPSLVIADEAHSLKNAKSKISQFANQLKTNSRIALTGSPLNNHLEEYHTMVDWIAPGYLGTAVQFRAKYSEPIEAGLYTDSSASDKRLSVRKLHVLKRDLDPKINRADISAIEKDMPSKTEYFITIPLTDLQEEVYNIYVVSMLQSVNTGSVKGSNANAKVFEWIAMLGWLCHHPSGFVRKLKERQSKTKEDKLMSAANGTAGDPNESSDETPAPEEGQTPSEVKDDLDVDVSGPLSEAMQRAMEILPAMDNLKALNDPALSYRTQAVKRIVEKATEAGDKTLIFSHSIPTLNYLADMLTDMKCSFRRIDGKIKVTERQDITKKFNQTNKYKVLLISMRAGGLGLNLQGANRVVIFDFSFNPTWEQQAIGRAFRLNQTRPVFVYRFRAGGTFEDRLFNTSLFKTHLFGRVVDKKNPKRYASKSQHTDYLFPVKDVPKEDFADCIGKDPKVLDAIIHELGFVRSIVLTETFQKEEEEDMTNEEQKEAEEEYEDQRLRRDDPKAWEVKQKLLYAQQRRSHQPAHAIPPSTMPNLPGYSATSSARASGPPGAPRSTQYSHVQPPFGKDDFRGTAQPQRPQVVANINRLGRTGGFDDNFQDQQQSGQDFIPNFSWMNGSAPSAGPDLRS